jgi:TRAP-type C4-dicarboxylate transport system substrate-binding protein
MSNKNPFEIRSEILELAKEYMDKQIQMNIEYAEKLREAGEIQSKQYLEAFTPYKFEDLMTKAKEMYSFVSTKETEK